MISNNRFELEEEDRITLGIKTQMKSTIRHKLCYVALGCGLYYILAFLGIPSEYAIIISLVMILKNN